MTFSASVNKANCASLDFPLVPYGQFYQPAGPIGQLYPGETQAAMQVRFRTFERSSVPNSKI